MPYSLKLAACLCALLPCAHARASMLEYFADVVTGALMVQCGGISCTTGAPDIHEPVGVARDFNEFLDADSVMFVTKGSFDRLSGRVCLIDVGAKLGESVDDMVSVFGVPKRKPLNIYAFEPNPESARAIESRIAEGAWGGHNIHFVQAAVLNSTEYGQAEDGKITFVHRGEGDPLCSVSMYVFSVDGTERLAVVEIVVLDEFFRSDLTIHLLKIDVEGYDPLVLEGATRLLSRRQVKFLVFEYNRPVWTAARHGISLKQTVIQLHRQGMLCFILTRAALVPVHGEWWQDAFEFLVWANLFCGAAGDHDLFDAYVARGTNNRTLSWALANLKTTDRRQTWWH